MQEKGDKRLGGVVGRSHGIPNLSPCCMLSSNSSMPEFILCRIGIVNDRTYLLELLRKQS